MPPKKKQNVNRTGIYYLADEHRKLYPAYSRMSIHDLIIHLLPHWRSMTLVERKPYEDLAKQHKRARMLNNENVITPVIPSSEEASFIEKNSNENKFLDSFFSNDLTDVFKRNLYFVTFQIFCRADDEDGGDYYPAEISIMKYSFCESVKQEYFTIMKPEKFPIGYTGTAIDLSRETHQIPPFNFIGANGDYSRIWQEVKRVIGDSVVDSAATEPIIIFCNAFERDQTTYLLNWLVSKDELNRKTSSKPLFRIFSFEALVAAILRRLGFGDYAHQSVREQLRRPVYTIQVKERCVYHDSLAIQYCCRAINHGFSLFLDGFVRQRFIQSFSQHVQAESIDKNLIKSLPTNNCMDDVQSISNVSVPTAVDSISSTFIEKQNKLSVLTQPEITNQSKPIKLGAVGSNVFVQSSSTDQQISNVATNNKLSIWSKLRVGPPIELDCRWPISSLHKNITNDEDQFIMPGRGIKKTVRYASTINSNDSDRYVFVNSIGRGRRSNLIYPAPSLSHVMQ
ncbi:unnamed protein product [Rotaria socialis]|uniref:Maelstrom domain-containing protein n=3 Tax=Rotaria socialis TaxID=392032 RepID=A0A817SM81_9BILA|nr:unnamed protein product [Rotaria socialis]CAF3168473.1 unnamed protein product [Rotaria socialis]CAF3305636.1 unnamed protein product [Rotaria socialis]CAF4492587.1 unnamed protein product [Rotaria socialis]